MPSQANKEYNAENVRSLVTPPIEFPWDEACSPHAQEIEHCTLEWGDRYALFPEKKHRQRAERARYGWLASRCYHHADKKFLQIASDYFLWSFLADDFFIDRVETLSDRTVADLAAIIDVLDYGKPGPTPLYGELAWADICYRFRSSMGDE